MKLGVLQFFSWPGRHGPLEEVYARALERIEIMDRTGFDAVWLAEHHFTTFSVCPSVHMVGGLAAARTKRLRIGTAVSLAALYHPLRLAEEVALLDMLSGGRVNWGAGRGFAQFEFKHFGVPAEESAERFREAVEIVLKAWNEERFSFKGTHFSFDDVEVLPKPLQRPIADLDGGDVGSRHRLGGGPRLFHPDGSAFLDGRARRQAPPLHREARRSGLLRCRPRHPHGAAAGARLDQGRGRGRRAPRRAMAGQFLRRAAASPVAGPCSGPTTARSRRSTTSTASSCTARPSRLWSRSPACSEEIGLNYLMCAPLSRESFRLLADEVLPRL